MKSLTVSGIRAVVLGFKSLAPTAVRGDDRPSVHALIATDFFLKAQKPVDTAVR